mgnify:CR=1 FL=1
MKIQQGMRPIRIDLKILNSIANMEISVLRKTRKRRGLQIHCFGNQIAVIISENKQNRDYIMKASFSLIIIMLVSSMASANQDDNSTFNNCLLRKLDQVSDQLTIVELKALCHQESEMVVEQTVMSELPPVAESVGIANRVARERDGIFNPFALTPHRANYIMFSAVDEPNQAPYQGVVDGEEPVDDTEMIFQVSFKAPLWREAFGTEGDLFVAYTARSWWQLFNDDISSPFRETNYEPEVFWQRETDVSLFGWSMAGYRLGFVHQSNGRGLPLSRSWNRVYAHIGFDRGPWSIILKPWYRIPEDDKEFSTDTDGDDNPDLWNYMGYGEYSLLYTSEKKHVWSLLTRHNFRSEGKGAAEITWSFPLTKRFRGIAQVFSGYGDSLIDYDESITRFSIGIALTDNL